MMERRGGESFDETDTSIIPNSTMVDITFCLMRTDITTEIKISSFNLILSLDFIMKVLEFLQPQELQEEKAQAEIVAAESRSRKSSTSIAATSAEKSTIKIRLKIEQPDIILVERMDDINCYALILNNEIDLKVRMLPEKMLIEGELRELCLYYCEFNPEKRDSTKHYVIHPCQLSLFGSTPEGKGLFINLKSTEINMSVSPAIIELVNNVLATLQSKETTVLEEDKKAVDYSDLWDVRDFEESEFWFIKADVAEEAVDLEDSFSVASLTKAEQKEEKCIIEIPKISLIIETGTGLNTIPMLYIETKFDASVDNWSSKLAINSTLCLNMSYFNQTLALWEYMIEPNVIERLDGQVEYLPWELQVNKFDHFTAKQPTILC
jgi:vacuolar protein sorting-associated protein 13A/C